MPGRVRPLLRALVPRLGNGPSDPADPHPRESPHTAVSAHRLRVPIPVGRAASAEQEGRLRGRGLNDDEGDAKQQTDLFTLNKVYSEHHDNLLHLFKEQRSICLYRST